MKIKLRNIRAVGRFKNIETGKEYNIKKGNRAERGTDHYFYLLSGVRQFVGDSDFHNKAKWVKALDPLQKEAAKRILKKGADVSNFGDPVQWQIKERGEGRCIKLWRPSAMANKGKRRR